MKLSYVIVTHNRKEPLLKTLRILHQSTPFPAGEWEAWVVDNASTDGSLDAVRSEFPSVNIIARQQNEGVWARSYAFGPARGEFLILLDDDSYPIGDAVEKSIAYLRRTPQCAAVVGKVVLPDGKLEACAMPGVMLSGAVCLRKSIVSSEGRGGVGGFRKEFFRKAGEYDFSFRIWQKGYTVERFEDIVYRHDKVMTGRSAPLAHFMDLRNNLILVERYIPHAHRAAYRQDYAQRYAAVAAHAEAQSPGCIAASQNALRSAAWWRLREALTGRQTLSAPVFEKLFEHDRQTMLIEDFARRHGIHRIAIADFSKTLYATYQACERTGLNTLSIADNSPAFAGLYYRGIPVLPDGPATAGVDAVIISNINPAQIDETEKRIQNSFSGPILKLWQPRYISADSQLKQAA